MNHSAQRGLALVVVLWVLVLLALVAASFSRTTRTEVNLARNLVENAQAEALADAGVHLAILALLDPDPAKRPRADGTPYRIAFGGAEITVSVQDEGGKIDLNRAPDELLRGLFVSLGVEPAEADALVDAIADFRDPDDLRRLNGAEDRDYEDAGLPWGAKDAPFEAVEELQQVLGVTVPLYQALRPALTVYNAKGGIDPAVAPREVLMALPGMDEDQAEAQVAARAGGAEGAAPVLAAEGVAQRSRGQFLTLRAEAHDPSGAIFVREAVVEITRNRQQPYTFRMWRTGTRFDIPEAPSEEN